MSTAEEAVIALVESGRSLRRRAEILLDALDGIEADARALRAAAKTLRAEMPRERRATDALPGRAERVPS